MEAILRHREEAQPLHGHLIKNEQQRETKNDINDLYRLKNAALRYFISTE